MAASNLLDLQHLLDQARGHNLSLVSRQQVREFLSQEGGMVLIFLLSSEISGAKDALAATDLAGDGGQLRGVVHQSTIKGLNRALDLLLEIANFEEEEKADE